ncbi:YHS domain protein [Ruegeria sediminis]|uniref:YHS domain protein n=1 Tax=Ruegeria sediminis TaxID=2583820 RepID=A0ABY2WZI8_9RHOB|nr:YHS domain-containing (seleno)protein [Ruegeria sediminis]TMV07892.1 YHS domain protein [Ruegeria sediminis]
MLSRRILLAGLTAFLAAPAAHAETPVFYVNHGAAIGGYDTVSYFRSGGPIPGRPEYAVMWKGAVWQFASQDNRELFEANPRAYAPQFGGYCAYAVGRGYLATTDPEAWRIVDGKLYLTHSPDVARLWRQDIPGNIVLAEQNWPGVLQD